MPRNGTISKQLCSIRFSVELRLDKSVVIIPMSKYIRMYIHIRMNINAYICTHNCVIFHTYTYLSNIFNLCVVHTIILWSNWSLFTDNTSNWSTISMISYTHTISYCNGNGNNRCNTHIMPDNTNHSTIQTIKYTSIGIIHQCVNPHRCVDSPV